MPLLFYGRLNDGERRLYSKDLRPIESSAFDSWKIKHLSPYREGLSMRELALFWWFEARKHCAISWRESRIDITLPHGIRDNEREKTREQTIFIPSLLSQRDALEVIRTEFPRFLVPSPLIFRFFNEREVYLYD
jgi:hypothetical protein